jgi:phage I-like protein
MPRVFDPEFGQSSDLFVAKAYANRPTDPEPAAARKAPSEFLIWRAGDNRTDHGEVFFTARSAEMLMLEQKVRNNLYPIDVDHLSLKNDSPIDSHRAIGWHALEVRPDANGEPELWAVNVKWSDAVRAGLEQSPPAWRYISPAFAVDTKTREVVSYTNLAVTNVPATWNAVPIAATRVAASRIQPVTEETKMNQPTNRGLPLAERNELRRKMGLAPENDSYVKHEANASIFHALTAVEARRILASRGITSPEQMRANLSGRR